VPPPAINAVNRFGGVNGCTSAIVGNRHTRSCQGKAKNGATLPGKPRLVDAVPRGTAAARFARAAVAAESHQRRKSRIPRK
jgi:hypothetical protein